MRCKSFDGAHFAMEKKMTGLYAHIPFCRKKCFYCSFIVAVNQKHWMDAYADALAQEMAKASTAHVGSIYFGGGTPSQMSSIHWRRLLGAVQKNFSIDPGAEITVEMNPDDVSDELLMCLHQYSVNRLSLGIQTFDDAALISLGRSHDRQRALDACTQIRAQGFDNLSIDLMYGFPDQTMAGIDADLDWLQKLAPEHVSLYSLTVEPGSRFFVEGMPTPDHEAMAQQYCHVRDRLRGMGFDHYEVSNFAQPGKRSIHNTHYWRGGNYIGLGVGAHSHCDGVRWWNCTRVRDYIARIQAGRPVEDGREILAGPQRLGESLVFGLRMLDGVDLNDLQARMGELSDEQQQVINNFVSDGFLVREDDRIKATVKGLLVLDMISEKLL